MEDYGTSIVPDEPPSTHSEFGEGTTIVPDNPTPEPGQPGSNTTIVPDEPAPPPQWQQDADTHLGRAGSITAQRKQVVYDLYRNRAGAPPVDQAPPPTQGDDPLAQGQQTLKTAMSPQLPSVNPPAQGVGGTLAAASAGINRYVGDVASNALQSVWPTAKGIGREIGTDYLRVREAMAPTENYDPNAAPPPQPYIPGEEALLPGQIVGSIASSYLNPPGARASYRQQRREAEQYDAAEAAKIPSAGGRAIANLAPPLIEMEGAKDLAGGGLFGSLAAAGTVGATGYGKAYGHLYDSMQTLHPDWTDQQIDQAIRRPAATAGLMEGTIAAIPGAPQGSGVIARHAVAGMIGSLFPLPGRLAHWWVTGEPMNWPDTFKEMGITGAIGVGLHTTHEAVSTFIGHVTGKPVDPATKAAIDYAKSPEEMDVALNAARAQAQTGEPNALQEPSTSGTVPYQPTAGDQSGGRGGVGPGDQGDALAQKALQGLGYPEEGQAENAPESQPAVGEPPVVNQQAIATRAYEISQSPNAGSEADNWLSAERQVNEEAQAGATKAQRTATAQRLGFTETQNTPPADRASLEAARQSGSKELGYDMGPLIEHTPSPGSEQAGYVQTVADMGYRLRYISSEDGSPLPFEGSFNKANAKDILVDIHTDPSGPIVMHEWGHVEAAQNAGQGSAIHQDLYAFAEKLGILDSGREKYRQRLKGADLYRQQELQGIRQRESQVRNAIAKGQITAKQGAEAIARLRQRIGGMTGKARRLALANEGKTNEEALSELMQEAAGGKGGVLERLRQKPASWLSERIRNLRQARDTVLSHLAPGDQRAAKMRLFTDRMEKSIRGLMESKGQGEPLGDTPFEAATTVQLLAHEMPDVVVSGRMAVNEADQTPPGDEGGFAGETAGERSARLTGQGETNEDRYGTPERGLFGGKQRAAEKARGQNEVMRENERAAYEQWLGKERERRMRFGHLDQPARTVPQGFRECWNCESVVPDRAELPVCPCCGSHREGTPLGRAFRATMRGGWATIKYVAREEAKLARSLWRVLTKKRESRVTYSPKTEMEALLELNKLQLQQSQAQTNLLQQLVINQSRATTPPPAAPPPAPAPPRAPPPSGGGRTTTYRPSDATFSAISDTGQIGGAETYTRETGHPKLEAPPEAPPPQARTAPKPEPFGQMLPSLTPGKGEPFNASDKQTKQPGWARIVGKKEIQPGTPSRIEKIGDRNVQIPEGTTLEDAMREDTALSNPNRRLRRAQAELAAARTPEEARRAKAKIGYYSVETGNRRIDRNESDYQAKTGQDKIPREQQFTEPPPGPDKGVTGPGLTLTHEAAPPKDEGVTLTPDEKSALNAPLETEPMETHPLEPEEKPKLKITESAKPETEAERAARIKATKDIATGVTPKEDRPLDISGRFLSKEDLMSLGMTKEEAEQISKDPFAADEASKIGGKAELGLEAVRNLRSDLDSIPHSGETLKELEMPSGERAKNRQTKADISDAITELDKTIEDMRDEASGRKEKPTAEEQAARAGEMLRLRRMLYGTPGEGVAGKIGTEATGEEAPLPVAKIGPEGVTPFHDDLDRMIAEQPGVQGQPGVTREEIEGVLKKTGTRLPETQAEFDRVAAKALKNRAEGGAMFAKRGKPKEEKGEERNKLANIPEAPHDKVGNQRYWWHPDEGYVPVQKAHGQHAHEWLTRNGYTEGRFGIQRNGFPVDPWLAMANHGWVRVIRRTTGITPELVLDPIHPIGPKQRGLTNIVADMLNRGGDVLVGDNVADPRLRGERLHGAYGLKHWADMVGSSPSSLERNGFMAAKRTGPGKNEPDEVWYNGQRVPKELLDKMRAAKEARDAKIGPERSPITEGHHGWWYRDGQLVPVDETHGDTNVFQRNATNPENAEPNSEAWRSMSDQGWVSIAKGKDGASLGKTDLYFQVYAPFKFGESEKGLTRLVVRTLDAGHKVHISHDTGNPEGEITTLEGEPGLKKWAAMLGTTTSTLEHGGFYAAMRRGKEGGTKMFPEMREVEQGRLAHEQEGVEFRTGHPISIEWGRASGSLTQGTSPQPDAIARGAFYYPQNWAGVPPKDLRKKGAQYGRAYEPSGRYANFTGPANSDIPPARVQVGTVEVVDPNGVSRHIPVAERGNVTFRNPLVIDFGPTGRKTTDLDYRNPDNWKNRLSRIYGVTGKDLSNALIADGYDGVVVVARSPMEPGVEGGGQHEPAVHEILDLTSFNPNRAAFARRTAKPEPMDEGKSEAEAERDRGFRTNVRNNLAADKITELARGTGAVRGLYDGKDTYHWTSDVTHSQMARALGLDLKQISTLTAIHGPALGLHISRRVGTVGMPAEWNKLQNDSSLALRKQGPVANPAENARGKKFINKLDEAREYETLSDEEAAADSENILGSPVRVKALYNRVLQGHALKPAETLAARRLVTEAVRNPSGLSKAATARVVILVDGWRETGREQARAMRLRGEVGGKAIRSLLAEAMYALPKKLDEGAKTPQARAAARAQWTEQASEMMLALKNKGIDVADMVGSPGKYTTAEMHRAIEAVQTKKNGTPLKDWLAEPLNATRAIMTSMDVSAVFRQGGMIALGHPGRAAKAVIPMLRAFASQHYADRAAEDIIERPNAALYAKSKLYLSDQNGPLSQQEEKFMSRIARKIPGVKGSERAYNTFLNRLRADSFDAMTKTLAKKGQPTTAEFNAIANYINVATGRGDLGKLAGAGVALNTAFFAPKYVLSRFQLLAGQPLYHGSGRTRGLIAGEYARMAIGLGVVYALAQAAGGEMERDPRSADFGKIKFGKTRLDPLAGLSQTAVFTSRLASGSTKSSTTGQVSDIRGNVPYGKPDVGDVIGHFLRSKLSPGAGTAMNVLTGKRFGGQDETLSGELTDKVPMAPMDIYQAIRAQGVEKGTALGLLALMGMGLQTYQDKPGPNPDRWITPEEPATSAEQSVPSQ